MTRAKISASALRHAELRIRSEDAHATLRDALDGYLAGNVSRPTLIHVLEHARVAAEHVERYERAAGIDMDRTTTTVADLLRATQEPAA